MEDGTVGPAGPGRPTPSAVGGGALETRVHGMHDVHACACTRMCRPPRAGRLVRARAERYEKKKTPLSYMCLEFGLASEITQSSRDRVFVLFRLGPSAVYLAVM